MNQRSLVTGIIIFFNGEKYLEEAIESVISQTYNHWELLLVDDGSTDQSTEIAQQYAQQYPQKIRYLEHENHQNRGMSATRNLGISQAKGEYIAFLDADDIWLPQKLETQVALLDSKPEVGIVFGATKYWYSWTDNPQDRQRDCLREIGVESNTLFKPPILLTGLLKNEVNAPATCSVLIRREVFDKTGGFEESFRGLFEDRVFFAKVYLKIPVFVTDDCSDWYRQHSESTCHLEQQIGKYKPYSRSEPHYNFLKWVENYLTQENETNPDVWQALRVGMLPYKNLLLHYLSQFKKLLNLFPIP
jgi:glycosyltransferase involved in cell wall biosynthesis